MIRAPIRSFSPLRLTFGAIPVLQEMREAVVDASTLAAALGERFERGDAAPELVAQLGSRVADLTAGAAEMPDDLRTQLAVLLARVEAALVAGEGWLGRTGPELATEHARQRLRRAYGVT